jgi:restriction system protein
MKNYYRIMLGKGSTYAKEGYEGNFIGADFDIHQDLSGELPEDWRVFNKKFIPIYLANHPGKHKIAAGLACGTLWVISKGIRVGDVVLCPTGSGIYHVGEVVGDYQYRPDSKLPHQRPVRWLPVTIERSAMSEALQGSTGSIGTSSKISGHAQEIERLIAEQGYSNAQEETQASIAATAFALEDHLETYLIKNWSTTSLAKDYDIYVDEEEGLIGKQYRTDTGFIDILAISKDRKTLLVIELKRGRPSDEVVGQVQRYMGDVMTEVAEPDQHVKGLIIGFDDDKRIRRALLAAPNIEFYLYKVRFELFKV